MKIGIIADDLTGAADSVAPFAGRGCAASVLFFDQGMKSDPNGPALHGVEALALDTGTRDKTGMRDTLRDLIFRRATRYLLKYAPEILYKKIDSTLRGHLRVELEAMRYVLPDRMPVLCPAFPANGRIITGGSLFVHGVRHEKTVQAAFDFSDNDRVAHLPCSALRDGAAGAAALLTDAKAQGKEAVFCDAETDSDLDSLAAAIVQAPADYLPVGSAGLSAAFARDFSGGVGGPPEFSDVPAVFRTGRVLVAVGSRHEVSRRQMNYLRETGVPFVVSQCSAITTGNVRYESTDMAAEEVRDMLTQGHRVIGATTRDEEVPHAEFDLYSVLSDLRNYPSGKEFEYIDAFIVTGGATARRTFASLFGGEIKILGEAEPGIVFGTVFIESGVSGSSRKMPIIVKSGSFGAENLFAKILGME